MKVLESTDLDVTVIARATMIGEEPIEFSESGTVFLRPHDIEVIYSSNCTTWAIAVTVTATLSLSRDGVDDHRSMWGATPLRWRGGSVSRPNLDEAPDWVRLFVDRNMPIVLAGARRVG